MANKLLKIVSAMLLGTVATTAWAAESRITMTTQAPEGTTLRIYSMPYNGATVTGADPSKFFGEYVSKGPGTEITLTGTIEQLEVYNCQLSALSVTEAPDLFILQCYNNSLESLDVSKCPGLVMLDCHQNNLASIDVSNNSLLENLDASSNSLTQAKLGSLQAMAKLNLGGNKLEKVDLTKLPLLDRLNLENNQLTGLDLSGNTLVKWIYVYGNKIAGQNMSDMMTNLPEATQSPSLLYIVDTLSPEPDGNVCLMKDVAAARDKGWVTMDYANGAVNAGMIGQFYDGADYVPTISDNGVKITTSRQAGEKIKLNIQASGDFTVEGVAETSFVSGSNTLTLTGSEVFVKGDLSVFECPGNDLTALTFVGNPSSLTTLDCSDNRIESLIINGAPLLTKIHAQKNAIKSMAIDGCTGIMRVNCYDNDLHGRAMKQFMQSLPDGTANNPYLFVIDTKSETEKNVANVNDVKIATDKNWSVFDYIGGDKYGMGTRYEGSEPTAPELPEESFTFVANGEAEVMFNLEFEDPDYTPVVEDAEVLGWGSNALTMRLTPGKTVKVYGDALSISSNLTSITELDATGCPNVQLLNLSANAITKLDVSKNAKLQNLLIFGNELQTLDVSGCTDLRFIICYGNRLEGEAMTQFMSTLPMRSSSAAGQIIIYDGTYEREHNVCTEADVEAAKTRNWITFELGADGKPVEYKGVSGIEGVETDSLEAPVEYYNLQGIRVDNPRNGIFIRRSGSTATTVRVR